MLAASSHCCVFWQKTGSENRFFWTKTSLGLIFAKNSVFLYLSDNQRIMNMCAFCDNQKGLFSKNSLENFWSERHFDLIISPRWQGQSAVLCLRKAKNRMTSLAFSDFEKRNLRFRSLDCKKMLKVFCKVNVYSTCLMNMCASHVRTMIF